MLQWFDHIAKKKWSYVKKVQVLLGMTFLLGIEQCLNTLQERYHTYLKQKTQEGNRLVVDEKTDEV